MLKKLLRGINVKRAFIATLVMFAFVWISDFVIHGLILGNRYMETAHLWRPEQEMREMFGWMLVGQLLIAKYFTLIFAKGYEGGGMAEGARFGLLMGPLMIAPLFVQYAVSPLPQDILWSWVGFGYLQAILGGIVVSFAYKK